MTAAALLALALLGQEGESAAEFFPLREGTTWTYLDDSMGASTTFIDRVGATVEVAGGPATPIVSTVEGRVDGSSFYRVVGDTVLIVGFAQNKPLASPYPVLKVKGRSTKWEYQGETQWLDEPAPLTLKGTSKRVGKRDVLGVPRETLEVKTEARIGPEKGTGFRSKQVALYAQGVGLFDLKDTTIINRTQVERRRRLVAFQPAMD